jgi:hypothetical protein
LAIPAGAVTPYFENRFRLLLVEPAEQYLESFMVTNPFHGVESIAQLIVRPGLGDEICATPSRGRDFASALAARRSSAGW